MEEVFTAFEDTYGVGPVIAFMLIGFYTFMAVTLFVAWVVSLVSAWVVFEKANKPGWAMLIPIYNVFVLLQIARKPWWWLLVLFVGGPVVIASAWFVGVFVGFLLAAIFQSATIAIIAFVQSLVLAILAGLVFPTLMFTWLARAFGKKSLWYGIGFSVLPFVFWPMFAFGDVHYAHEGRS